MRSEDRIRWKLRSKTYEYKRHVNRAVSAIYAAHNVARMIVSWSTGKDSTAMTHLVRSLYVDTPIMIQFDDCDWQTKHDYAGRVANAQGWDVHRVEPDFSVWECIKNGRIGEDNFCSLSHTLTRDAFLTPLAAQQRELDCNGVYMGLRAEESRARRIHLRSRGELYQLKSGEWRCCPLARWTSEDVFAYLVANEIEINPCYFNNRFLPPEEIRVSWAIPTPTSIRYGDMEHIRYYYPEQFRRIREIGVC
jgi:3'-phosphoadenosine 5'-phosphosulfate sulfotransferase (PAPS reductase)/FAD synthetase